MKLRDDELMGFAGVWHKAQPFVNGSVAASIVRPSAAVAVGAVLCRLTASATRDVPTTAMTLTSWFSDMTR